MDPDRELSYIDYQLEAARASVEVAYVLDFNEQTKDAAFRRLDHLLRRRDRWREFWQAADR